MRTPYSPFKESESQSLAKAHHCTALLLGAKSSQKHCNKLTLRSPRRCDRIDPTLCGEQIPQLHVVCSWPQKKWRINGEG